MIIEHSHARGEPCNALRCPVADAHSKGLGHRVTPTHRRRAPWKLPLTVRQAVESALTKADSGLRAGCSVPEEAQEAMRLYLNTWVAGPLREVLDWDDGRIDADRVQDWGVQPESAEKLREERSS